MITIVIYNVSTLFLQKFSLQITTEDSFFYKVVT
jgi:hypothetical protein